MISAELLRSVLKKCTNPESWVAPLQAAAARFSIDTPARTAAFLAQIAVESSELFRLSESLGYTAPRLVAVWPGRFTPETALRYERNPIALANYVYANRLGNGDEASGDGYRYRGRGLLMTTGKDNYARVENVLGVPVLKCPDMLCTKGPAALAAGVFWQDKSLNDFADAGTNSAFAAITRHVNSGSLAADERRTYWQAFKLQLGVD